MSEIRLNDFRASWSHYRRGILAAVERVGESGWLVLGSEVSGFEEDLSDFWGLSHCIGCGSGLDALELALRASGLESGQKVLTTPLSAFATALAITRAGGIPVFVDVDDSAQIDLDLCESAIESDPEISFLVPVHLYGHANDARRLEALRDRFSLVIVEDCAQAIGAKSRGVAVGNVGASAATSFYPTKNLGCLGDGGAVLTNDLDSDARVRSLRDYGQVEKFEHRYLGLNSRLDELQASILRNVFLPDLARATRRRSEVAEQYRERIENPGLVAPPIPSGSESVWHLYPLLIEDEPEQRQASRQSFRDHLQARGVKTGIHYPRLIPDQKALKPYGLDIVLTSLGRARRFADTEVSIPIHPFLSDSDVDRVVDACNSWRR